MYCSSCGVAVAQGLTFCIDCGARLNEVIVDSFTISSELNLNSSFAQWSQSSSLALQLSRA